MARTKQSKWKNTSEKQKAANRRNSKKCTGPKDTSIVKYNALTHGLTATVLVDEESRPEFEALHKAVHDRLAPKDILAEQLVDDIAFNYWRLKRARQAERAVIEASNDVHRIQWDKMFDTDYIEKILRYESHAKRQLINSLNLFYQTQAAKR